MGTLSGDRTRGFKRSATRAPSVRLCTTPPAHALLHRPIDWTPMQSQMRHMARAAVAAVRRPALWRPSCEAAAAAAGGAEGVGTAVGRSATTGATGVMGATGVTGAMRAGAGAGARRGFAAGAGGAAPHFSIGGAPVGWASLVGLLLGGSGLLYVFQRERSRKVAAVKVMEGTGKAGPGPGPGPDTTPVCSSTRRRLCARAVPVPLNPPALTPARHLEDAQVEPQRDEW